MTQSHYLLGTPYVWPGLQSNNGVLQAVCDGRSGVWWIGILPMHLAFPPVILSSLQATASTEALLSRGATGSMLTPGIQYISTSTPWVACSSSSLKAGSYCDSNEVGHKLVRHLV